MRNLVLGMALLLAGGSVARADGLTAKEHYKKGISYYALQKFAEAAAEYEAAFEMQPDPALLYNAAQAHRLAGNKQRALALYMSFLRMFPEKDDGTVLKHIAALRQAIEAEGKAARQPPTETRTPADTKEPPTPPPPETAKPATPPTTAPATSNNELTREAPPPAKKKTPGWVWGVVAGAVVVVGVGLGVGLGIGLSGNEYPSPSVGKGTIP
jgi:tetratricopeptide (TPR) repeat protein